MLGVNQYKFSVSWSRVFPDGTINVVNQIGVDYYNKMINTLIESSIEPIVTLYHWDLPEVRFYYVLIYFQEQNFGTERKLFRKLISTVNFYFYFKAQFIN